MLLLLVTVIALDYLHNKHSQRETRERKMEELQAEIRQLNESITKCQQQLPSSGIPVTTRQVKYNSINYNNDINKQRYEENKLLFKDYVQQRTNQNYKFWIVSFIYILSGCGFP